LVVAIPSTSVQSPEPEATLTLGYGRFDDKDVRFGMNQPLTDNLYARVGLGYQSDDGYMTELNTGDGYGNRENRKRARMKYLVYEWGIDKFRAEFQEHMDEGGCPYGGASSLEALFAPVDQHTHHPTVEVPA
jgi:sulfite reductase beta subunit-like hemoprotein